MSKTKILLGAALAAAISSAALAQALPSITGTAFDGWHWAEVKLGTDATAQTVRVRCKLDPSVPAGATCQGQLKK